MFEAIAALAPSIIQPALSFFNAREQSRVNDRMEANSWDMYQQSRQDQATAVQTRAKDMIAAGINPLMAAGQGAGVSSGSSPSLTAPQIVGPDIMGVLNFMETVKNNKADRGLKDAQAKQLRQQVNINKPLENALPNTNSLIEKGKSKFKDLKKQVEDANDSPQGFDIIQKPIKKNPSKKIKQFQQFWNNRVQLGPQG